MKIPKNLGRYEVLDLISQGGMGTLFRARDPRIGRNVAIKVLKKDFDTPELRDRFSREARAAGCLSHPNIVTIYDVGEEEGLPFIAMEYVRGETFMEVIGLRPPLPVDRKLQLMEEVCAGLAHAHEAGIVHRDIKPANLIVSSEGLVKILDFGIAKLSSAGLTMPGVIMGTLNYMAPEQAKGDPVDARTDIFAVGVVMYELLSHQPAFSGTRASDVLHRILSGTPTPITEYCPDLDPRLIQVIDRTLEKDPDKRFQTVAAVQKAIAAVRLDWQADGAPRPTRQTRQTRQTAGRPAADPAMIRAEQIDEHLAAAARAFESGDYDAAIEACKQVLMLDASNARAFAQLDRIHAAADERQAALQAAIERGRSAYQSGNLMAALREVKQALTVDPYDADARALSAEIEQTIAERQEDARLRAAVDAARRRFGAGDHHAAIQSLEGLPAANALVRAAIDELRRALRQIEEQQRIEAARAEAQRRIAALAADARAALAADRLDEAARIAVAIGQIDAAAPEHAEIAERVRQAQAAARAREEVGRALAEFDLRLGEGNLRRADELLAAAAAAGPGDPRLPPARRRLSDAQAADARQREGEGALDAAAAKLQAGELDAAGEMLKRAADLVPGHVRAAELSQQLQAARESRAAAEAAERLKRKVDELVHSASAHLEAGASNAAELPMALHDVSRALELDAGNAEAAAVKAKIDAAIAARREAARAKAAVENAGRRFANGKHLAAIKLLEEFDPPDQPDVAKALGDLRSALQAIEEKRRAEQARIEREQRLAALVKDARGALAEQRFDAALQLLAQAADLDPAAADVAPLRDQIRRERKAARLHAEVAAIISELDDRLAKGDVAAAREVLSRATALSAADPAVASARQRLDEAVAQREAAATREREAAAARDREAAAAREREAASTRDREAAAAREREAAAARDGEAAARERSAAPSPPALGRDTPADADAETIFAADLQEAVRAAIAGGGRDSQRAATTPQPPIAPAAAEPAADDGESARRKAEGLLAAARAQLAVSQPSIASVTSALTNIEQALAAVPNDVDALALETTANETLARLRDAARIDAAIRNARSRFAIGKRQAAIQLLESLGPESHPPVQEALTELRAALQAIEDRRREAQSPPKPRTTMDDDATRVIFLPDLLLRPPAEGTAAPAATLDAPVATPATAQPIAAPPPLAPDDDSRRRMLVGAGVLLLALVVALLMLRFAS